jgi:hypothetical protein
MDMIRQARGSKINKHAQRILICFDPKDAGSKDQIVADLLSIDSGMDCVVSWVDPLDDHPDLGQLHSELQESQLLVLWVTTELLASLASGNTPAEFLAARELHVPVLPIAGSGELFPQFTEMVDAIHGISTDDAEYRTKLKAQLEIFLASEEIIRQIQEKAFSAADFLSYRKMDIA